MSDLPKIWYIHLDNRPQGPFTSIEVAEKCRSGEVDSRAFAFKEGMPEWQAIDAIPELSLAIKEPPPAAPSPGTAADDENRWMLNTGSQVSGLYSLNRLRELAVAGKIPPDARIWQKGWLDFEPLSAVPEVASALHASPIGLFASATPATPAHPMPAGERQTSFISKPVAWPTAQPSRRNKKIYFVGVLIAIAAAVFLFPQTVPLSVPADLDVTPADMGAMNLALNQKANPDFGLYIAAAVKKPDASTYRFYVASNAPPGTRVDVSVKGWPQTLASQLSFAKSYPLEIGPNHIAVFDLAEEKDSGPFWGSYAFNLTAPATKPLGTSFFLGEKNDAYKAIIRRIEEFGAVKSRVRLLDQVDQRRAHFFSDMKSPPAEQARTQPEGKNIPGKALGGAEEMAQKLKDLLEGPNSPVFYRRAFEETYLIAEQNALLERTFNDRLSGSYQGLVPSKKDLRTHLRALDSWIKQAETNPLKPGDDFISQLGPITMVPATNIGRPADAPAGAPTMPKTPTGK